VGRLEGKTALITGAASGQGAAEAHLFASEGARVVVADIDESGGRAVASELGDAAVFAALDVTDEQQWSRAVAGALAAFGRVDVLVNNAGVGWSGLVEEMPADQVRALFEINVLALIDLTQKALR